MLIIRRQVGERLVTISPNGDEVVITIIESGPGEVCLGVQAPRDVKILRVQQQQTTQPALEEEK